VNRSLLRTLLPWLALMLALANAVYFYWRQQQQVPPVSSALGAGMQRLVLLDEMEKPPLPIAVSRDDPPELLAPENAAAEMQTREIQAWTNFGVRRNLDSVDSSVEPLGGSPEPWEDSPEPLGNGPEPLGNGSEPLEDSPEPLENGLEP
jgi:hypothetical protein